MKKLLVILLLFFPFHGAWAENFPKGFFGIKFGDKFDKKLLDIDKYIVQEKVTGEGFNEEANRILIKPPKPNDFFSDYYIGLTPISKKIYIITGISRYKTLDECKQKVADVSSTLEKKYKKLPPFSLDLNIMNKDKRMEWVASTLLVDELWNPGKENYFNFPFKLYQQCFFNINEYEHQFNAIDKKLLSLELEEQEELKHQGF